MKKILVIGCSGVGKSTFARQIASVTALPYIATDPFYWEADWQPAKTDIVVERVNSVTLQDVWVLDGNFDSQRAFVWQRADTIIWLDYPFWQVLFQISKRNLALWLSQNETWSGNKMTWKRAWSGICHAIKSHRLKRKNYPECLQNFPHINIYRFTNSSDAATYLTSITKGHPSN